MREELNFEVEPAVTLGYENLAFPFLVLLGGLAAACAVTACERLRGSDLARRLCKNVIVPAGGRKRRQQRHHAAQRKT